MGFYILQSGDDAVLTSRSVPVSNAELAMPGVAGLTIRIDLRWKAWKTFLQHEIDRCNIAGKRFTILILGGQSAKPWLPANVKAYKVAASYIAFTYGHDPLFYAMHITGMSPQGHSEEMYWDSHDCPTEAVIDLNAFYVGAFPNQRLLFAIAGTYMAGMERCIKELPLRCIVKINNLKADTRKDANHVLLLHKALAYNLSIGYEANQPRKSQKVFDACQVKWAEISHPGTTMFMCEYKQDVRYFA